MCLHVDAAVHLDRVSFPRDGSKIHPWYEKHHGKPAQLPGSGDKDRVIPSFSGCMGLGDIFLSEEVHIPDLLKKVIILLSGGIEMVSLQAGYCPTGN